MKIPRHRTLTIGLILVLGLLVLAGCSPDTSINPAPGYRDVGAPFWGPYHQNDDGYGPGMWGPGNPQYRGHGPGGMMGW